MARHCSRRGDVRAFWFGGAQGFFETDAVPLIESPQRSEPGRALLVVAQSFLHLGQGQIRLFCHQRQQIIFVRTDPVRAAISASGLGGHAAGLAPTLHPLDRRTGADFEAARHLADRHPGLACSLNHALTQIL
jgi:hypothetical protein